MKTIIHVHQQVIRSNRIRGTNEPPLTVKTYKSRRRAHTATVLGPCKIVHRPHDPLSCGERVWIETESEVLCDDDHSMEGQADSTARACTGEN